MESQIYRFSGLTLLTAAITLWNTGLYYIETSIDSIKREVLKINDKLLAHLPALGSECE